MSTGAGLVMPAQANVTTRIKDIVSVEGIRENMLVGYGMVVGLNGTGDNLKNSLFTQKQLEDFLTRLGVNIKGTNSLKTKNIAAVTVTASLPAFARQGGHIDIKVSTMGDAKSLEGGTLLATTLLGADGKVYAVAQGSVTIGGFEVHDTSGTKVSKGVPTNGFIANGAIVENEVDFDFNSLKSVNLSLRNPDVKTSKQIADVINKEMQQSVAFSRDPGTVNVALPESYQGKIMSLMDRIETLPITPDQVARIVVDEASGTIVMGEDVKIDTVAVAQGNLIIKVEDLDSYDYLGPFPEKLRKQRTVTATEPHGTEMALMDRGATLKDLVKGLNSLGLAPRDLITILQTIKASGALQADIEVR
ncbi:MAG: flagellar basal body P-ring protein FlgI [Alphaproteobacteria bacterium]|nr:flagellar basal body P-ring protein FlgI [Alphaproteobacteria bacterium]